MQTWPSTLPQSPYYQADDAQSNGLLDPEEMLHPRRLRTYPEYAATFIFNVLSISQFQVFRAWWDDTLNQCAPFTAPWLAKVGFDHHLCRFDVEKPWSASLNGKRIKLSINLEIIATVYKDTLNNVSYYEE